ncbi:MAG: hypothetical protein ACPG3Z_00710 [Saprospiraceae bacterium]
MMKSNLFLFLFAILPFIVFSQNGNSISSGGKGAAMANTSVTFQDVFALTKNQAGIAFIDQTSVGILGEQRFLNSDIRHTGLVAAMPLRTGTFGVLLQSFGFDAYNEQKIGLAYGRELAENFAIGIQFDYLNTRIPEYGNQGTITFEGGIQAEILENLWIGAAVFNPIRTQDQDSMGIVNTTKFNLGFSYLFSKKILLAAEVEKDFRENAAVKFGLDYHIVDPISLRVGVGTAPTLNSFGIGIHLEQIRLDFAASYHQILGFTPTFSMSYHFRKNSSK